MFEKPIKFLDLVPDPENANYDAVTFKTVVKSGRYILDGMVEEFERRFAEYNGVKHCVGVGNGFDALQVILRCIGIGNGDHILIPANAPLPVWMAVTIIGAKPIPCEPSMYSYGIDPLPLVQSNAFGPKSKIKAILAVHLYGLVAPVDFLKEICNGIPIIEDCCQAHGAELASGAKVGSFGVAGAFSFYPTKNMSAYGDGGAITTNDDSLAEAAREIREYGKGKRVGINSRLDELHAALLVRQLIDLNHENGYRRAKAMIYNDILAGVDDVLLPVILTDSNPVWHQFVIQVDNRDELRDHLFKNGVETMVHYPTPVSEMPLYKGAARYRIALYQSQHVLSLPIGRGVTMEDVHRTCDIIKRFYGK